MGVSFVFWSDGRVSFMLLMTGAVGCLKMMKIWVCVILLLCWAGFSVSNDSDEDFDEDDLQRSFDYGTPTSATVTGISSKLAPGAHHYVSAPPLPSYNGHAYRPLPQYAPSWAPYGYGFPPPRFAHPPHYGYGGYGFPPPFMPYGYRGYGGFGGHFGGYGGYGAHFGGYGGPYYGGHGGHYHGGHGGYQDESDDVISSDRSGKLYAGRNNFGSGFITQHAAGSGKISAPAQYSQHIQQVADYIPIANQLSLAFDDPVSPYVGTHFTKDEPNIKHGMDMTPPSLGTAHLPSIYQVKKGGHSRRRRSLGSPQVHHSAPHHGYPVQYHPGHYNGYYGQQPLYHPNWDTYYQRKAGYNAKLGYGNYNPYVFDYQTAASLDDPLLTAHYPSDYYGYSLHQLPSLRPSNPFQNQAPGLALNPHYQYSRAAYQNYLHQSMDGVDPVEYVKQSV